MKWVRFERSIRTFISSERKFWVWRVICFDLWDCWIALVSETFFEDKSLSKCDDFIFVTILSFFKQFCLISFKSYLNSIQNMVIRLFGHHCLLLLHFCYIILVLQLLETLSAFSTNWACCTVVTDLTLLVRISSSFRSISISCFSNLSQTLSPPTFILASSISFLSASSFVSLYLFLSWISKLWTSFFWSKIYWTQSFGFTHTIVYFLL